MTHRKLFILIVFVGLLIRLWRIDLPLLGFYPTRQVQTAEITRNLSKDFNLLKPKVHFYGPGEGLFLLEFPLYNLPIAIFYKFVGVSQEYFGRLFSILGWGISTVILYKLARKYTGEITALTSVFIYTFSPLSVLTSRSFQPDQWMLTLSIAAIFFIDKWTNKPREVFFYLGSFLATLAILIKAPAFLFTFIPIFLIIWFSKRQSAAKLALFSVIAVVPSILWYLYSASLARESGLVNAFTLNNWFRPDLFINTQFYATLFGYEYNLGLMPIGILLFLIGLAINLEKGRMLLYSWFLGVVLYFVIFNRHNMVHEYYHLPLIPIASIFGGIAVEKIVKNLNKFVINKNFLLTSIVLLYLIPAMIVVSGRGYQVIPRFGHVFETASAIQKLTKPADLIIGSMDAGPTLVYYAERTGWDFDVNRPDAIYRLETLKDQEAVIFASAAKEQFLQNEKFAKYMYENYKPIVDNKNFVIFDLKD